MDRSLRTRVTLCMLVVATSMGFGIVYGGELCGSNVCENDGRCFNNTCICMDGWIGPDCANKTTCGQFPIDNAVIVMEGNSYTGTYEEIITYTCMDGYQFEDAEGGRSDYSMEKHARCSETGTWEPKETKCLAMCPPIPSWRGYLADTTRRLEGTIIRYLCYGRYAWYEPNPDELTFKYRFVDGKEGDEIELATTCMPNGTWTPPIRDCMEMEAKGDLYSSGNKPCHLLMLNIVVSTLFWMCMG